MKNFNKKNYYEKKTDKLTFFMMGGEAFLKSLAQWT